MKNIYLLLIAIIALTGCSKEIHERTLKEQIYAEVLEPELPYFDDPEPCITNLAHIKIILGSDSRNVSSVVLEDGTEIFIQSPLIALNYSVSAAPNGANSLFDSRFSLRYNLYGYEQNYTYTTWSLGCIFPLGNNPNYLYTNISVGGYLYKINSRYTWPVTYPIGAMGKVVTLLKFQ